MTSRRLIVLLAVSVAAYLAALAGAFLRAIADHDALTHPQDHRARRPEAMQTRKGKGSSFV